MKKRKGSVGKAETSCHHHWMTYGSSVPGDGPFRVCFNCGARQEARAETLPRPVDWKELDGKQVWVRIIKDDVMLLAPDAIYRVDATARQDSSDG